MANEGVDHGRRRFLTATTAVVGGAGVVAVAIPFINVNKENTLYQRAPGEDGIYVTHDFIGTAHALTASFSSPSSPSTFKILPRDSWRGGTIGRR